MNASRTIAIVLLLLILGACSSGDAKEEASRCESVPPSVLALISQGMTVSGPLQSAQQVKSKDFAKVWFVAAKIGDSGDTGVWASNGENVVLSVNTHALASSDWINGGQTDAKIDMTDDGATEAVSCVSALS